MIALLIMFIVFGAFAVLSVRYGVDSRVEFGRSAPFRVSGRHQLIRGAAAAGAAAGVDCAGPSGAMSARAPPRPGRVRSSPPG